MLPILIPVITALAPFAARAIGSALGGGAGKEIAESIEPAVTAAALQATGKDSVEAARDVLLRDPASEEAKAFVVRMNEIAGQIQMAQIQAELERARIESAERSNARDLLKGLAEQGSINAYFMPALTTLYTAGFFFFAWWLLTTPTGFDERRTTIVNVVSGALIIILKDLIAFWTGTTAGSKMKDARDFAIPPSTRAPEPRPAPVPPVVVVPPGPGPAPVPPPAPEPPEPPQPAPPGPRLPVPVVPAPSGLLAEVMPGLVVPHRHFPEGVSWALTPGGLAVDGGQPERTPGEPATVRKVWSRYGDHILSSAKRYGVPVELIVATICTESRGDPSAHREEPQIGDASTGLMQTLLGTAREALGRPSLRQDDLMDPATSIDAGTAYIAQQRGSTRFDPPLVAAAYNAGSVRKDTGEANRWKLRCYPIGTGRHVDTFVAWLGDAMVVAAQDGWGAGDAAVPSFAACIPGYFGQATPPA